jgi:hypothetical protein
MGYDIHITRKANWFDEGPDIPDSEWQAYVTGDPEMSITGAAEAALPEGRVLRYENTLLAEWRRPTGGVVWFDFRSGRVVVKNPDEATVEKMKQVARALRARVQGDDGESYGD